MSANLKSLITAIAIAGIVLLFSVRIIAPKLPTIVGRPDAQETRSFMHANPGTLRLDNTDGLITVSTTKGSSIAGEATIRAFRRGDTTEQQLNECVANLVQVHEEPGVLVVQTESGPRPADFDLFVEYKIEIPVGTNVEISSNNGNVWIQPGCGNVHVAGRNSDIEILAPLGTVSAESVNGRIQLAEAPSGGTLKTVNGDVYAEVQSGNLQASTDNGVIHAKLLGTDFDAASLTSQNGGVNLDLAEGTSASITATSLRGSVESQFAIDTAGGAYQPRYLKGKIGGGRAQINLDTLNGNIVIARNE